MIIKKEIEQDLLILDKLYNQSLTQANSSKLTVYTCKLGVLELSGWVEVSLDEIARRACQKRFKLPKYDKHARTVVKKTSGFEEDYITRMFGPLIGYQELEALEMFLNQNGRYQVLLGELELLTKQRNKAAHENIATSGASFDSPSKSLGRLRIICPILKDMYRWFCHTPLRKTWYT